MRVTGVAAARGHRFSKTPGLSIRLVPGLGVLGDAHAGETVRHRWARRRDPDAPNLRQVHLIGTELLAELAATGFPYIRPGDLGENVTTSGIDLLALPDGARLELGNEAVVTVTGLRHPCVQLDRFRPGLMRALLDRAPDGSPIRKAGIMAVVLAGGDVAPGDPIRVVLPDGAPRPLRPV